MSVFFPELILLKSLYVSSVSEWDLNIYLCSHSAQSSTLSNNPLLSDIDQDAKLLSMCLITKINNDFKLTRIQQKVQFAKKCLYFTEDTYITMAAYEPQLEDEVGFEMGKIVKVVQKNLDGWWFVK